jgi:hypothetical protein
MLLIFSGLNALRKRHNAIVNDGGIYNSMAWSIFPALDE